MKNINNTNKQINCTLDDTNITLPKYETICASGMDLSAWKYSLPHNLKEVNDFPECGYDLFPNERILIKTGLHIEFPPNTEAQIRPRSGLALKHGISIVNSPATIDEDFRGDIGVVLINMGDESFNIKQSDRIAQLVFQEVKKYDLKIVDRLSETIRGEGGFGHTGV